MGDYSVHSSGGVNLERHRRRLPIELNISEYRVRMPTVLDDDEDEESTATTAAGGGARPETDPNDAAPSYASMTLPVSSAGSTRSRVAGQSATVDRVKQKRKRRHRVAATTSETALCRRENETTSYGADDASPQPRTNSACAADVASTGGLPSPAVYGGCASPRPWTDNEWCECSSCHSADVVSLPTSCYATDPASVSPSGVGGVRSDCKRCAGCAAVNLQCLSPGSATIDPSGVGVAPAISSSSGFAQIRSVTAEVPKVRLKVVYYHNRFVAVPVNSPPLPLLQPHKVASSAVSTSTVTPVTVGSVPSSVVVPIVIPQCPSSSLSGIVPDTESQRPIESRQLPNPSPETATGLAQSHSEQQRPARTLLRRIIDCLEDRDDKHSKDDSVNRRRHRRRENETDSSHSSAFDTLVKTLNWCFLIIGLLLFLGVIGVIIYTSIDAALHSGKTARQ